MWSYLTGAGIGSAEGKPTISPVISESTIVHHEHLVDSKELVGEELEQLQSNENATLNIRNELSNIEEDSIINANSTLATSVISPMTKVAPKVDKTEDSSQEDYVVAPKINKTQDSLQEDDFGHLDNSVPAVDDRIGEAVSNDANQTTLQQICTTPSPTLPVTVLENHSTGLIIDASSVAPSSNMHTTLCTVSTASIIDIMQGDKSTKGVCDSKPVASETTEEPQVEVNVINEALTQSSGATPANENNIFKNSEIVSQDNIDIIENEIVNTILSEYRVSGPVDFDCNTKLSSAETSVFSSVVNPIENIIKIFVDQIIVESIATESGANSLPLTHTAATNLCTSPMQLSSEVDVTDCYGEIDGADVKESNYGETVKREDHETIVISDVPADEATSDKDNKNSANNSSDVLLVEAHTENYFVDYRLADATTEDGDEGILLPDDNDALEGIEDNGDGEEENDDEDDFDDDNDYHDNDDNDDDSIDIPDFTQVQSAPHSNASFLDYLASSQITPAMPVSAKDKYLKSAIASDRSTVATSLTASFSTNRSAGALPQPSTLLIEEDDECLEEVEECVEVEEDESDDDDKPARFDTLDDYSQDQEVEGESVEECEEFQLNDTQSDDAWDNLDAVAAATADGDRLARCAESGPAVDRDKLPIDAYADEIIYRVNRDRVTIIHGETGCGKSSRLPVILLEHCERIRKPCRMMISQPRRIAAASLMKRLRETLGDKVGMRMGHGIKDETDRTKIHFVTTGYLVRLLAHHPESFDEHTHLIIDEVHERSVDGDLLCLLARRLLDSHPSIRLILMSATIHTRLYKEYFSQDPTKYYGDLECLSVGVRRFPVEIRYLDEISIPGGELPQSLCGMARDLLSATKSCNRDVVPPSLPKQQYNMAFSLIKAMGRVGTGILVFVSGIADITDLTEKFEGMDKYKVIAIHSEIPFEEQETAFQPAEPNEVKVIIATNAAESSITLPDVDLVICLGTHKALQYHSPTHRVHLVNTWISKASATQRAGRTGRVRPGKVYRLYGKKLYETLGDHEESEIHRTPLQDVILGLRSMLEEAADFDGVIPILEDLLEPPDTQNVINSFDVLYSSHMITSPDDEGELTSIGRLAAQLPVDIQLGRLICYGINLGVGAESIIIASALSQPKTLFRVASPLIHTDPDEMNEIIRTTLLGSIALDCGMYSEPMMHIKLFIDWNKLDSRQEQYEYARDHGLAHTRVKSFVSTTVNLLARVKESINSSSVVRSLTLDRLTIPDAYKQNMLRLILAWNSEDNILEAKPLGIKSESALYSVALETPLTMNHLKPLFPKSVEWKLEGSVKKTYDARFTETSQTPLQLLSAIIAACCAPITWLIRSIGNQVVLIIALATEDSNPDRDSELQDELMAFRKAFFVNFTNCEKATTISNTTSKQQTDVYDIYVLSNPTKRELKWWNDAHDELTKSLSMLIPVDGHSKIRDNNCHLTLSQVQTLFFGRSVDPIEWYNDDQLRKKYQIHEQTLSSKQVLIFPNPLDKKAEKDRKVPAYPDLIIDIPLGMRLINAYRMIYKDKKMRLWAVPRLSSEPINFTNPTSLTQPTQLVPSQLLKAGLTSGKPASAVPGSLEWSKQRKSLKDSQSSLKDMAGEADGVDDDENKITFNVKAITTTWINMTGFGRLNTPGKPPNALLSRQSPISVAVHCGPGVLYAVAYNSVALGSDGRLVFVEGVTVLPPGNRWMTLALRCMGKNVSNQFDQSISVSKEDESDGGGKGKKRGKVDKGPLQDRPLTESERIKCGKVYELLQRVSRGPVCPAPGVISELEDLFSDWIDQRTNYAGGNGGNNSYDSKEIAPKETKKPLSRQQTATKSDSKNAKANQINQLRDKLKIPSDDVLQSRQVTKRGAITTTITTVVSAVNDQKKSASKKTSDNNSSQYDCSFCGMKFSSPIYLYRHTNMAHKAESASNALSPRDRVPSTSDEDTYHPHTNKSREDKQKKINSPRNVEFTEPPEASFAIDDKESVTEFMSKPFRCSLCDITLPSQTALFAHNHNAHRKKSSKADECSLLTGSTSAAAAAGVILPPGSIVSSHPPFPISSATSKPTTRSLVEDLKRVVNITSHSATTTPLKAEEDKSKTKKAKDDNRGRNVKKVLTEESSHATSPPSKQTALRASIIANVNNDKASEVEKPRTKEQLDVQYLCCSLYNSTRGCCKEDCTHAHYHPEPQTPQWELLRRQFKNLVRRPNFKDLVPLPELKF